jgi:hypothetical protein
VKPLTPEEWVGLMENADLREVCVRTRNISTRDETRGIFRQYGCMGMLRVWNRMLVLYLRNPAYRTFVKGLREGGSIPDNVEEYYGYGLYVGRK